MRSGDWWRSVKDAITPRGRDLTDDELLSVAADRGDRMIEQASVALAHEAGEPIAQLARLGSFQRASLSWRTSPLATC